MAWSAADDAVVAWQSSPEFEEAALEWARENLRCKTCEHYIDGERERGVENEVGPLPDWGCTLWERKP